MTDQTLNPPWIVRGDTVVDDDGVVVARAPADADTEEGDARWQHRAARIAAVPLLIEACQGALRAMKGDDSDEEDALHNALVVSTGEAQGLDLFTMARRLETMTQHYKDARDVVKLREADVARHSARADEAVKELALVRGELEACKAAHLECEEELGALKEAIAEHLPQYVPENDPDDHCSPVENVEHAGDALKRAERARDEVGLQYAAAQERLRLASSTIDVLWHAAMASDSDDEAHNAAIDARARWDAVPGDALAPGGTEPLAEVDVFRGDDGVVVVEVGCGEPVRITLPDGTLLHGPMRVAPEFFDVVKAETLAAISEPMAVPTSPAGASAPASGSTPGASSATGSSSEAAASPSAHRGTPEWYLRLHDAVYAEGPYPTRDAAIADAKAYGYLRFHVGRCRHLHVGIGLDVDDIMERIEDAAHEEFECDGDIFDFVTDRQHAQDALEKWADEHIKVKVEMGWYWSEAGEETIILDDLEQEGGAA